MNDHDNTIVTRHVVVDYRGDDAAVRALAHDGIVVPAGTSLAVMGASGCGKSTLLGLLAGLAVPTEGSVDIGPITVSTLSEPERVRFRRAALGMVYQADNLLPYLTVEENVGLQLAIARSGGSEREGEDPVELLGRLGLGALATRLPDQLSGGQRQRVAVARAVVHRPSVILADEPTGSLDNNARVVIELLVELQHQIGATMVIVTHTPAIAAYTDAIVHLSRPPDSLEFADAV